jgi:glycosyltransferase involved in cell wall biosynthesis
VITEQRDRNWPAVEHINGYEIQRLPCLYQRHLHIITSLMSFFCFLLLRGRSFDVWHVHQYGLHSALAVALGKLLRRPVMIKLTSSAAMGIERAMGDGLAGRILGILHRRANACIAISEETHEEAIRFGIPSEHVHLIPNGLDSRQFFPASPEKRIAARLALGLGCERMVLYVGRLSPEKNPIGLLNAWSAVDSNVRAGALLALVGDGPEWNKVNARIRELNLADSVHLAGKRSDVETWYQAADIYVISSHNEGLSNTMIEAMASGLPVISTRVSGSSVISKSPAAGLIVAVDDVKQLSVAIGSLLRDEPMRMQFGMNARKTFESNFSLESVVPRLHPIYEQLVNFEGKAK